MIVVIMLVRIDLVSAGEVIWLAVPVCSTKDRALAVHGGALCCHNGLFPAKGDPALEQLECDHGKGIHIHLHSSSVCQSWKPQHWGSTGCARSFVSAESAEWVSTA